MENKPLPCTIKPPALIKVGDPKGDFHTGCSVIDVTFTNVFYVEVSAIYTPRYSSSSLM